MNADKTLRKNNSTTVKLTKGCEKVLDILKQSEDLTSAQEIHVRLRQDDEDAPGLTTVYRSLETLVGVGFVQAVDLGDGERRYELVRPGEHHHHLVCERCGKSVHLDQCLVKDLEQAVKRSYDFQITSHVLEIFGVCKECR